MARESFSAVCNLDDHVTKRQLLTHVGALSGLWRVELAPHAMQRSSAQNRWYHGCIVKGLFEFLRAQDYEVTRQNQAHQIIAAKLLTVDVVNKATGEIIGQRVRSTTELSTIEFADFCERARVWLAEFFNVQVPDPE